MIVVCGRLQNRDWTDRDGNKRTSAEVVADSVYFGEAKRKNNEPAEPQAESEPGFSDLADADGELPF